MTVATIKPRMAVKHKHKIRWNRILPFYIMGAPMLIYLFINNYMPLYGLLFAFKQVNLRKGVLGSPWVGLDNFLFLFATDDAWIMTRNTVLYNLAFLILGPILGITIAICLNTVRSKLAGKIYQTTILLPNLMSMVVVSYLVYALLSPSTGMLNSLIQAFGGTKIDWYADAAKWPFILIFTNQWHALGFNSIVYLSSIVGISQDYYEAAELDGASKWQQITKITLPLLKGTVITLTILGIGRMFRSDFGLFYQVPMNNGALYSTTQTIDTYVFRALLQLGNFGMSSAAGFYQSVVGFILVVTANAIIRKISSSDALF